MDDPPWQWLFERSLRIALILLVGFALAGLVPERIAGFYLAPFGEIGDIVVPTLQYAGIVTALLYAYVAGVDYVSTGTSA